jgi:aspartate 1-decarboxylase
MATVTESNLSYEGSLTLDGEILKEAGILPYEQIMVSNLNNGERFETYIIPGKKGEVCLNGPTARKGVVGDQVIIFCYGYVEDSQMKGFNPKMILLGEGNTVINVK